jgi:hypothetical protein
MRPERVSIMFDGWTHKSQHFIGAFACFEDKKQLLSMAPIIDDDIDDHTAASHMAFLGYVLSVYGKTRASVVFIVGDNCSVNHKIAFIWGVPLVGCASHRLNLAVKLFKIEHKDILAKMHSLMVIVHYECSCSVETEDSPSLSASPRHPLVVHVHYGQAKLQDSGFH